MALIKEVKGETLRRQWRLISLLFAQLVLIVLIVFQLLAIFGLHVNFQLMQFVVKPVFDPADIVVLGVAVAALALLMLATKKKEPELYQAGKEAPSVIKQEAKKKLRNAKTDPRTAALLLIEFMFVAVVVVALQAYLDPDIELIPWSKAGIGPPYTTAINAVIAFLVLCAFYWMYRLTAPYRKSR
jgi:hypothetical protein